MTGQEQKRSKGAEAFHVPGKARGKSCFPWNLERFCPFGTLLLCLFLNAAVLDAGEFPTTAIVELFTSEGCSSCPRADALLGQLTQRSWDKGQVYGLAFHVDYWDRLGWKDRFSDRAFTERQHRYAASLSDSRVYTPQMIVDGRIGFVGSVRTKAIEAINTSLSSVDQVGVVISIDDLSSRKVGLNYEVAPSREGLDISVAIAQRDVSTDVERGENAGRVLEHTLLFAHSRLFRSGKRARDRPG